MILEAILIIGVILFIYWQFKVMKKYSFNYTPFKADIKHRNILVNKEVIKFKDIDFITIEEIEQPSAAEKILTRSGAYCYMSKMLIYMKNGEIKECIFNYKGILYKTLKDLKPYIKIEVDIEQFKPNTIFIGALIILLSICIIISILSIFRSL